MPRKLAAAILPPEDFEISVGGNLQENLRKVLLLVDFPERQKASASRYQPENLIDAEVGFNWRSGNFL